MGGAHFGTQGLARLGCTDRLLAQEFAVHFKDLPDHYTMALYDLYQQVNTADNAQTAYAQGVASCENKTTVCFAGAALDQG